MNKEAFKKAVHEMIYSNQFVELGDTKYYTDDLYEEYNKLSIIDPRELLEETIIKKNTDYSGEDPFYNFTACERELGIPTLSGFKVRMLDKKNRILNLRTKNPLVVGESLQDSILDLAGYIVLFNIYDKYIRNG